MFLPEAQVLLPNRHVPAMEANGAGQPYRANNPAAASAKLYDPMAYKWTPVAKLVTPRRQQAHPDSSLVVSMEELSCGAQYLQHDFSMC